MLVVLNKPTYRLMVHHKKGHLIIMEITKIRPTDMTIYVYSGNHMRKTSVSFDLGRLMSATRSSIFSNKSKRNSYFMYENVPI